jgi:peptidoglycan/xylan/chitin deacetylase (PgdA/CDA1 family)
MPRVDRVITIQVVQRLRRCLQRCGWRQKEQTVPILMYHSISDDPEPGVPGYYRLNTPPAVFRGHLEVLQREGYSTSNVRDAMESLMKFSSPEEHAAERRHLNGRPATARRKTVVITFDDGFKDFHTAAWPLLKEFGFTATVFLPTGYIRESRLTFLKRECLTWGEVQELSNAGVEFGSHTVTHPKLWELSDVSLKRELRESRADIEMKLQKPVDTFAHPYAFPFIDRDYVRRYTSAANESGYRWAVTTALGRSRNRSNALGLQRLPANGSDDAELFQAKLEGSYDWMAVSQNLVKRAKALK